MEASAQADADAPPRRVFAVGAVTAQLAKRVDEFPAFWVEGEVTELKRQDGWGLVYWTLKDLDGSASLRATMVRASYDALPEPLADGLRVVVLGRLQVRRKTGEITLKALRLEPAGLGSLLAQIERLRARLAQEGLFAAERKRPLPRFPTVVGLVCGRDAAARGDVLTTAAARFPPVRFRIIECAVQGPTAPAAIIRALQTLDADREVDVIILARGGGSAEDLAAFSDEELCRAIAAAGTPVVSAIGHEQDAPLADHVADVRASTPTHAGRLVVPDAGALLRETDALAVRSATALHRRLAREREALAARMTHPVLARPDGFLDVRRTGLASARARLTMLEERTIERARATTATLGAQLRALGPASTLERGYAIAIDADGHVVTDAGSHGIGDAMTLRLARGQLTTTVTEVTR